ncbi:uncharacterized protein LOC143371593 [Andrena cerasifolii]|uniref:uncharacterized protein LOC143371593 n=1 Tax=Andrena cerasifolii TaxID=2819439 RepID=UPI004037DCA6
MFGYAYPTEGNLDNGEGQTQEQLEQNPHIITVSIPKVEPYYPSSSDTDDNVSNDGELLASPIPFTTPYKVRDPIILLERCDKIWETLKLIKNVQGSKGSYDAIDTLPPEISPSSLYIKYQPVLGNDNAALPNFKFSVKTTKKLYYCSTCGRQYTHNRTLRYHSERVHGIYIAPKRNINTIANWKNADKEKYCTEAAKEKTSLEKIPVKKNETKLCTDTLLQPVPAQITEPNNPNIQPQRKRRSILTREAKNVTVSKTVTNEQEKEALPKKFRPNEKPHFLRHDAVSPQCMLCKQFVKDVKKHLTDYHKINSPDFMLKEIEKTSAISQIKELEKIYVNNECSKKEETTQEEDSAHYQRKRKRRSNVSSPSDSKKVHETNSKNTSPVRASPTVDEIECEVCLGIYSLKSYARHIRTHQIRGETKENFHLFNCSYWKSPLYMKPKGSANSSDLSSEDTSNHKDTNGNTIVRKQNKREKFSMKHNRKDETTCPCGRAFRNPHTLYIHKGKCNFQNEEAQLSTEGDILNASTESATRNSSDRDSGIGISIRIKKKNNSYEVVGKDDNSEDRLNFNGLKDSGASSDTSDDSSKEEPQDRYEILESSKYSEHHSILKIELADEDIDVDIEEDSQNSLWNNNINDRLTTDEVTNDIAKEDRTAEQPLETERKEDNTTKLKITDEKHGCVCGSWFSTTEDLEAHIDEHRQKAHLMCGYCKQTFPNLNAWNQHQCSTREGKAFVDLPILLNCPQCSVAFHTLKKFDEHIKLKHIDFVVPYQCYYCHKRFPNPTARQCHLRADHGTPPCSLCKKKYPDIMKSRHEGYHYGLGYPCHVCRKAYTSRFYLAAHKGKVHPKISTYSIICDNCKSRFPNERDLKTHTKDGNCRKSSWAAKEVEVES